MVFVIVLLGCNRHPTTDFILDKGIAFGTPFHIKYKDSLQRDFSSDFRQLFATVNQSVSTYHPSSIISRLNRDEHPDLDTIFKAVFIKATKIHHLTGGMFDPTIGILVNAWGFGSKPLSHKVPDSTAVSQMMTLVGLDKVHIQGDTLSKPQGLLLDFNAIAKGYGVDLIGRFLEQQGIEHYMVEIGGEVRTRGLNPKGTAWQIAIEQPHFDGKRSIQEVISLKNESVATSGNYRKYRIDDKGHKYVHTIDPKTGWTAKNDMLSASVIGAMDCADLDAMATAMMAMGIDRSKTFAKEHPQLKFFFIYLDEEGEMQIFKNFLSQHQK